MNELDTLYESQDLIAVNKPSGLLSIPGNNPNEKSLSSILEARIDGKVYIVHRLDREASGAILFAKNPDAHRYMNQLFSSRAVSKRYLALVQGVVPDADGVIDRPIRRFGSGRMGVDPIRGKPSLTRYQAQQLGPEHSLLEISTATGRRHQIRVHLYSLGYPIVGDRRYGDLTLQKKYPRLMLHAAALTFPDMNTESEISITAPLPASFQIICDQLV